ncbi:MAG TPA: hypothetical protein VK815_07000 [Candidatus Acidoferrales bacterium]|nr:hypothetical protein [Candidatus Acidoferrales bacterium]
MAFNRLAETPPKIYLGDEDITTVARDVKGSRNALSPRRRAPANDVFSVMLDGG